jgi:hypothetical protein
VLLPAGDDLAIVLFFMSLAFGFGLETTKAETIARKIAFGLLTAACLLTSISWLQIKKIWPSFTEVAISVGTKPVAWFVVLMFILAVFAFHRPKRNQNEIPSPLIPTAREADPEPEPQAQKIFIDVSPTYLTDLYKHRTSVQGDALAAVYLRKWMSVTGKVADISVGYGGNMQVLISSEDEKIVSALFLAKDREKISHIAHDTTITIRGQLWEINDYSIKLRNCEID